MKFPAVEKVLGAAGQAEIDSVKLSFALDKIIKDEAGWDEWADVRDQVQTHIGNGMGESAEEIEFDEMAGQISIHVEINFPLDTKEFPADLVPKFDQLCREAFAKYFP